MGSTEPYNPYKGTTHLCASYGPYIRDDGNECLLSGLTCEDEYGDEVCPGEYSFECTDDLPQCGGLGLFASVVYVEGDSFTLLVRRRAIWSGFRL